jgi:hypothetical protein
MTEYRVHLKREIEISVDIDDEGEKWDEERIEKEALNEATENDLFDEGDVDEYVQEIEEM